MSTSVYYKGVLRMFAENEQRRLLTAGKFLEDDITIVDQTITGVESVFEWVSDLRLVADEDITLPAFSTSAKYLKPAQSVYEPIPVTDADEYTYFVFNRVLIIPEYSTNTPSAGRQEYGLGFSMATIVDIPGTMVKGIADSTAHISTNWTGVFPLTNQAGQYGQYRQNVYYDSAGALASYRITSTGYGFYPEIPGVSYSNSEISLSSPNCMFRGHATYMSQANYNLITDVRFQYVIDVIKVPHDSIIGQVMPWNLMNCAMDPSHSIVPGGE